MKVLTSAEFRKSYHYESEPVEVTAYGRVIGMWVPASYRIPTDIPRGVFSEQGERDSALPPVDDLGEDAAWMNAALGPRQDPAIKRRVKKTDGFVADDPLSVPGKFPPDHTMVPGGAPRSTSVPKDVRPFNTRPFTPVPKTKKTK